MRPKVFLRRGVPLEQREIEAFVNELGGAPSTVISRLAALKQLAKFRHVPDPTAEIDRPRGRRGIPKPVGDLYQRLEGADRLTELVALFLVETGLRIGEACSLQVKLPVPYELTIRGKGGKERIVPLTDQARFALSALGGRMPWGPRNIQRLFQQLGFNPHRLRHTRATTLIKSGADIGDVQKILGHASPATTMVYAAYGVDRLRAALDRATALNGQG